MNARKERALVVTLGVCAALLLLEVALRLSGAFYLGTSPGGDLALSAKRCTNCTKILCVGDSFTYGIGASTGNDYPKQLENVLNNEFGKESALVFNGGVAGANTSVVLTALEEYLTTARPDIVVVLVGQNNQHNHFGYHAYLERGSFLASLEPFFFRIRVIRLASFIFTQLSNRELGSGSSTLTSTSTNAVDMYIRWHKSARPSKPLSKHFLQGADLLKVGRFQEAMTHFDAGVRADPNDSSNYWGVGACYRGLHRYEDAHRWYEEGFRHDPRDPNNYFGIGELAIDQAKADGTTKDWFQRGIEADPHFAPNYYGLGGRYWMGDKDLKKALETLEAGVKAEPSNPLCYSDLSGVAIQMGAQKEVVAFLQKYAGDSEVAASYIAMLQADDPQNAIEAWVRSDLAEIVELTRRAGATPVFQNYPSHFGANRIIAEVARKTGCPLVDHEIVFEKLYSDGVQPQELQSGDGHCNDRGYAIMAKNIRDTLVETGLITGPSRRETR